MSTLLSSPPAPVDVARRRAFAPTPEKHRRDTRRILTFFGIVLIVTGLIVYFLYPRVPMWSLKRTLVQDLSVWSDGKASLAFISELSISNANFMSTGFESVHAQLMHNGTILAKNDMGPMQVPSRGTTTILCEHDMGVVDAQTFAPLFNELESTQGELCLSYSIDIETSETFRLRNIHVQCDVNLLLDPSFVPPSTVILSSQCTHKERTG